MAERVSPITLTDEETGKKYTLEFSKESVSFAERKGFVIHDVGDYPMTKVPDLFYYAFHMHHKEVARSQTDKILLEDLGGLTQGQIERLIELYDAPIQALVKDEEESGKNSKMTVEM